MFWIKGGNTGSMWGTIISNDLSSGISINRFHLSSHMRVIIGESSYDVLNIFDGEWKHVAV